MLFQLLCQSPILAFPSSCMLLPLLRYYTLLLPYLNPLFSVLHFSEAKVLLGIYTVSLSVWWTRRNITVSSTAFHLFLLNIPPLQTLFVVILCPFTFSTYLQCNCFFLFLFVLLFFLLKIALIVAIISI